MMYEEERMRKEEEERMRKEEYFTKEEECAQKEGEEHVMILLKCVKKVRARKKEEVCVRMEEVEHARKDRGRKEEVCKEEGGE